MRRAELERQKELDSRAYQKRMPALARRIDDVRRNTSKRLAEGWKDLLNSVGYTEGMSLEASQALLNGSLPARLRRKVKQYASRAPRVEEKIVEGMTGSYTVRKALRDMARVETSLGAEELQKEAKPLVERTVKDAHSRAEFNRQKDLGFATVYKEPSEAYVSRVADRHLPYTLAQSFTARTMSEPMWETLMEGIRQGQNPNVIGRALVRQAEDMKPYKAKMIARTVITEASADSEAKSLEEAGIQEYQFISGLDERTCPVCGNLDGKTFNLSDREPGVNCPPMHLNCRCTIACVIPPKYRRETETRSARDKEGNWTKIPSTMTYEDWKAQYAPEPAKPKPVVTQMKVEDYYKSVSLGESKDWSKEKLDEVFAEKMDALRSYSPPVEIQDPSLGEGTFVKREFAETKELATTLKTESQGWREGLTPEQKEAIQTYTGNGYRDMNKSLYNPEWSEEDSFKKRMILANMDNYEGLDSAIASYELKEDLVVYRGMGDLPFKSPMSGETLPLSAIQPGDVYHVDSYFSCSLDYHVPDIFGSRYKFHILIPKGKGSGAYVDPLSSHEGEKEYLVKRSTDYQVIQIKDNNVYMKLIQ